MADETSTDQNETPATEAAEPAVEADGDLDEIAAKAENATAVSRALKAEREAARKAKRELDAALAKVKEHEDRNKSEQEKLAEENARLKSFEGENLRLRVAMEKQLPAELVDRLRGDNQEELEADADELLSLMAAKAKEESAPRGNPDLGARNGSNQISRDALKTMSPTEILEAQKEGRLDHMLGRG